jgi:DNA-binding NarL/FixJ family response regulator
MAGTFTDFYISKQALPQSGGKLSSRSTAILDLISKGHSDSQILKNNQGYTRDDICIAANEALILNRNTQTREERVAKIQQRFPRAYERWSSDEEWKIRDLFQQGKTMREIASIVQRQPNAVKSRLERMGLFRQTL